MGEPLVEVRDLVKHFPITSGIVIQRQVAAVHAVDGVQIEGVSRQAIKSIRRHTHDRPAADFFGYVGDQRGFRMVGVNLDDFGTQPFLFATRTQERTDARASWIL